MDSLTADNTKRRLELPVSCVKLVKLCTHEFTTGWKRAERNALRVDTQSRPVDLHEPQQYVLRRFVGIRTTGIVRKVLL